MYGLWWEGSGRMVEGESGKVSCSNVIARHEAIFYYEAIFFFENQLHLLVTVSFCTEILQSGYRMLQIILFYLPYKTYFYYCLYEMRFRFLNYCSYNRLLFKHPSPLSYLQPLFVNNHFNQNYIVMHSTLREGSRRELMCCFQISQVT